MTGDEGYTSRKRWQHGVSRETTPDGWQKDFEQGSLCLRCGAWRGCYGNEPTVEMYVEHTLEVLRAVWRVLRKDGTCWWNLGDSYASGMFVHGHVRNVRRGSQWHTLDRYAWDGKTKGKRDLGNIERAGRAEPAPGLKPKDLCLIPQRVALAAQEAGWWIRSMVVWQKLNPMPESVTDRPTSSYEHVILMTKGSRYFYDADAVRENFADKRMGNPDGGGGGKQYCKGAGRNDHSSLGTGIWLNGPLQGGRNLRDVWNLPTQPNPLAHFATFPEALARRCILAGCPAITCAKCGAGWRREVEKEPGPRVGGHQGFHARGDASGMTDMSGNPRFNWKVRTLGFGPACTCPLPDVPTFENLEGRIITQSAMGRGSVSSMLPLGTRPGLVLDPFLGSGTTALAARQLGRDWVGCELSPTYADLIRMRLGQIQPEEESPTDLPGQLSFFRPDQVMVSDDVHASEKRPADHDNGDTLQPSS